MKEYDNITLEELRCTDYMANHGFGEPTSAFGQTNSAFTTPNTATSGGIFRAKPGGWTAATTQQSTLFGANQQNKPLFGATSGTTGGFGQPTSALGQTNWAFGTPNSATSGGIFGAKPATSGFGAAATTASSVFGFGRQTITGIGQPQQQQNSSIGLFGQQNQASIFGSTATTNTGPAFSFGQTTNTFSAQQQKPAAFGQTATGFGGTTGGFGTNTFGGQTNMEIGTSNIQSNNGGRSGSSSRHNGYNNDGHPPGPRHRETGIIKKLLHSYGFIQCFDRQAQLFFHFSQFDGNIEHLKIGDQVEFEMTYDPRTGKPIASSVSKITPGVPKKAHEKRAEMLLRWKLKGQLSKKQEVEFEKALDSSKSFSIKASKLLGQKLAREKKPKAPKKPKKLSGLLRSIADCLEEKQ